MVSSLDDLAVGAGDRDRQGPSREGGGLVHLGIYPYGHNSVWKYALNE